MSKIIIGVQGGKGSTNERAGTFFAHKYGWNDFEIQHLISTENVLIALENKEIDYGTFAWESSRGGFVRETQEAIKKYRYEKIDEEIFQLDHALLCNGEIDLKKTIYIYSHPQALKEHGDFLLKQFKNVQLIEEIDTAIAAEKLAKTVYPKNSLIIAPISCANIYNLDIYLTDLPSNQGYLTKIFFVQKTSKNQ